MTQHPGKAYYLVDPTGADERLGVFRSPMPGQPPVQVGLISISFAIRTAALRGKASLERERNLRPQP